MTKGELYQYIDELRDAIKDKNCEQHSRCDYCPLNYKDKKTCVIDSIDKLLFTIHQEAHNDYKRNRSKT